VREGGEPVEIEEIERDGACKPGTRQRLMRIIPICGTALVEVKVPDRAAILAVQPFTFKNAVAQRVDFRVDAIFEQLRREYMGAPADAGFGSRLKKWALRRAAGVGWRLYKGKVLAMIGAKFAEAAAQAAEAAAPPRRRKRAKKFTGWRLAPPPASPPPG
jgi:hypothetical protein